jgi:predicted NUDIX family NTP pyrophosphohydrolase
MAKHSAGILLFRRSSSILEILLVHPGGPFWAGKDEHAWSIPKGECAAGEEPLETARRELMEETGIRASGELLPLGDFKQPGGKIVHAWATLQDFEPASLRSNSFQLEWPPRSGKLRDFPEVDRAAWFTIEVAKQKIHKGQVALVDRLDGLLAAST